MKLRIEGTAEVPGELSPDSILPDIKKEIDKSTQTIVQALNQKKEESKITPPLWAGIGGVKIPTLVLILLLILGLIPIAVLWGGKR